MSMITQPRVPAGSPTGGRFSPNLQPESDLELAQDAEAPHPVASLPPGTASATDLLSVVRCSLPEEGIRPRLTRAASHRVLVSQLPGLSRPTIDLHLSRIDWTADRLAAAEGLDPDDPDLQSLDTETATTGVSLQRLRDSFTTDADACRDYRRELVDHWADELHCTVREAWVASVQARTTATAGSLR